MLTPFQGGLPRKPIGVQRLAAGVARLLFRAGKPVDVPADAPLRVERDVPGKVRVVWANGPADVVGIDGIGAATGVRVNPQQVDVALTDGNIVRAPLAGGSAWRLTDAGVSLANPKLRLDGTVLP